MRPPVFWRVVDGVTWIQIHSVADRRKLKESMECRRVSYSVAGPWLEVWEVKRTLSWVARHLKALWSDVKEVWGSDL